MSHYVGITLKINDQSCLVKALERLGFQGKVEVHEIATNLYGYKGDMRPDKANVILRKVHVGGSSNDIGFIRKADGCFEAIISEFDRDHHKYDAVWIGKLKAYYGIERAKLECKKQGMRYVEEMTEDNRPRLRIPVGY